MILVKIIFINSFGSMQYSLLLGILTKDGADKKFVPAVRTASAASVRCPHRVCICCTLPCPHPCCVAIAKFNPLTAMAICDPSPEALCFSQHFSLRVRFAKIFGSVYFAA